jgi:hypothetical protein
MEFTFKISEAEFLSAWKLRRGSSRASVRRTVLFWVFIFLCLVLLWTVVGKGKRPTGTSSQPTATQSSAVQSTKRVSLTHALLVNTGPFFLLLAVWAFLLVQLGPNTARRMYRKDPAMQGQFTVNITPESISTQNTAGTSSKSGWNVYAFWLEGKDVIVLMFHSGACFILGLAGLSAMQRDELRGILAMALPKK